MYEVVVFITRIIIVVARLERRGRGVCLICCLLPHLFYIYLFYIIVHHTGNKMFTLVSLDFFYKRKTWRAIEG